MISKKAQLKIQEMAFMLVGVVIFFVIVGLFALTIINSNLQKEVRQIHEEQVLSSLIRLSSSPEFSCVDKSNCVDVNKLIGLMKNKNYQNFWDFSSLIVLRESGLNKSFMVDCSDDLSNFEECDKFVIFDKEISNEKSIGSYIALCRIEYENYYPYEKCELGRLIVGMEVKG